MRFSVVALCACVVAMATVHDVHALSFGRVRSAVTLGQPLSIAVPITLDDAELLQAECVRVEVLHGEAMWPANAVRARVTQGTAEASRVVRITSTTVVEEPVVIVTVHAGCPTQFSRSYTLLGDPPLALPSVVPADRTSDLADAIRRDSAVGAAGRTTSIDNTTLGRSGPRGGRTAAVTADRSKVASASKSASSPRVSARAAPRARDVAAADASGARAPPASATTIEARAPGSAASTAAENNASGAVPGGSRLRLDAGGPSSLARAGVESAQAQAENANASALAAERAASAAQDRLLALESEIAKLRADSKAQLNAMLTLQAQLAQRDAPSPWLPLLAALAILGTGSALWLGLRLRQARHAHKRDAWWSRDSRDLAADAKLDSTTGMGVAPLVDSRLTSAMPVAEGAPNTAPRSRHAASASAQAMAFGVNATADDAQRAVTVDEQIDLEQEADFFIALGHDDAAIDLLLAHLRSTGGSAPLPYLKLLELYRRRGEREDYELMRRRFNQRFNSVAPEWDHDANAGRVLEDYPVHLLKLQAAWAKPIDAMAELEAMAFGRSDDDALFDLPAYQDVLFLYQLARKLHDDGRNDDESDVDVLLPLDAFGDASASIAASPSSRPTVTATLSPLAAKPPGAPSKQSLDLDISSAHSPLTPYRGNAVGELPKIDLDLPLDSKAS